MTQAASYSDLQEKTKRVDPLKLQKYTRGLAKVAYLCSIEGAPVPDGIRQVMDGK